MRYIPISAETNNIEIGYRGDNESTTVLFVIPPDWPLGEVEYEVRVLRPGESLSYAAVSETGSDGMIRWLVTSTDTAIAGYGKVQFSCSVNGAVAKTKTVITFVGDSL